MVIEQKSHVIHNCRTKSIKGRTLDVRSVPLPRFLDTSFNEEDCQQRSDKPGTEVAEKAASPPRKLI
jgi:hypothetical protein